MQWNKIIGQKSIIKMLQDSINENRISHAQLFVGKEGYGGFPLALAYATEILTKDFPQNDHKVESLNHLDLHFSFPVYKRENTKEALCSDFATEYREMILNNPYANQDDWTDLLDVGNKQLFISVYEVKDFIEQFSLKSQEGGYKILILSGVEKIREDAANKFLKFLEEPPDKTVILLLADSTDYILQTILSRCQLINIPQISAIDIQNALIQDYAIPEEKAKDLAFQSQGDWNLAMKLATKDRNSEEFESYFITWVRSAFQAKTKPKVVVDLIQWASEIAGWNREKQKQFLDYCSEIFRLALMQNYGADGLVYKNLTLNNFKWDRFSRFVHGSNIEAILQEINRTGVDLRQNGNAKIVWTDMGIKLTRYIHRKA